MLKIPQCAKTVSRLPACDSMASQPDHAEETRNYRASLQQKANAPSDPTASSTSSRVALDPAPGPGTDNLRALIFVDVDGVLCNSRSQRWYEGPVCDPQDRSLVHPPGCEALPLERRCLGALQALAQMTRAEVVVSSWWGPFPLGETFCYVLCLKSESLSLARRPYCRSRHEARRSRCSYEVLLP